MSNKTRLQANNTNLQSLIEKANALPDAGDSGGGSIETCTLAVTTWASSTRDFAKCFATVYNNGIFEDVLLQSQDATTFVIENVVCGSAFSVYVPYDALENSENAIIKASIPCSESHVMFFTITASAGETATINMYVD